MAHWWRSGQTMVTISRDFGNHPHAAAAIPRKITTPARIAMRQNGPAFQAPATTCPTTVRHMVDTCVEASTYKHSIWPRHCSVHKGDCAMKSKVMFVLVLTASLVWGDDHKLSPELKGRRSKNPIDVIVQFKAMPTMRHETRVSRHGGWVKQHLGL